MLATSVNAQKGNNQIGIGAEVDFPMGNLGTAYKTGFGGSIKGLYGIGNAGQLSLSAGLSSFKGKSGTIYASQTFNLVPILAGYRHNFKSSFYLEPQAGVGIGTTKVSNFKFTQTEFAAVLNVGYAKNGFDISAFYHSEFDVLSMFGIRVAYNISLHSNHKK